MIPFSHFRGHLDLILLTTVGAFVHNTRLFRTYMNGYCPLIQPKKAMKPTNPKHSIATCMKTLVESLTSSPPFGVVPFSI